jgi:hypothetical protein
VDGAAEVEIRGVNATLRNLSGQPPQWRRFDCSGTLPANPPNLRYIGVDGRGRQELVRTPQNGGATLVRIQDPNRTETDILRTRATQALSSPLSNEVGRVVEQFGVDTFQVSPSFTDPNSLTSRLNPTARVTIGKRISDRAYLTFSRSLNSTFNDQILLLEYEASDRFYWVFSRNEDQQTYVLEFRVRHSF